MRIFSPSRKPLPAARRLGRSLALGPLLALGACSVYDEALVDSASPLGGSEHGGAGGSFGSGGQGNKSGAASTGGGVAGFVSTPAGSAGQAVAGSGVGGSNGGGPGGGSAGMAEGGAPAMGDGEAIDDMEDDDPQIAMTDGRSGYWYVGNDGTPTGIQDPKTNAFTMSKLVAGERPSSTYSAHMTAEGFTGWGTVMGFNFVEVLGKVSAYDASAYCGIRFWGKAAAATTLRFRLPDGDTHPEGKVCTDGGTAGQACYDHFSTSAAFTTAWKQFTIEFEALEQIGTGYHPADAMLKTDQLFGLEWALPGSGKLYEIWIDDVEFVACP